MDLWFNSLSYGVKNVKTQFGDYGQNPLKWTCSCIIPKTKRKKSRIWARVVISEIITHLYLCFDLSSLKPYLAYPVRVKVYKKKLGYVFFFSKVFKDIFF